MAGDLKNGRTVRSLSYLLGKFIGVEIDYVSSECSEIGNDIKEYLNRHNVKFRELSDLRKVASTVDVLYMTRDQVECGTKIDKKDHSNGCYLIVDEEIADSMKKDAIIMHPLPRVDEITPGVDKNRRAVYLTKQIDSGLLTRMALLKMVLTPRE
jgi:aspartate carbamoyltransferase catalytic subunit